MQEKVFEEVSPWDFNEPMTRDEVEQVLKSTPYTERCIKESMRLYPPVPIIGRKLAQDTVLMGHKYLKDSEILLPIFVIQREANVYKDPDEFRPERFDTEPIPPFAYVPFSAGARDCVGKTLAMNIMKLIVASLVRNFRLSSPKPLDEVPVELAMTTEPLCEIPLAFEPR